MPAPHCMAVSHYDADIKGHRSNTVGIPAMATEDTAFKNARRNSDRENARIGFDKGDGAGGARDGAGQHATLQAVRRRPVLQAVADEHRVPAGL